MHRTLYQIAELFEKNYTKMLTMCLINQFLKVIRGAKSAADCKIISDLQGQCTCSERTLSKHPPKYKEMNLNQNEVIVISLTAQ
jgi:hypothetical protein